MPNKPLTLLVYLARLDYICRQSVYQIHNKSYELVHGYNFISLNNVLTAAATAVVAATNKLEMPSYNSEWR